MIQTNHAYERHIKNEGATNSVEEDQGHIITMVQGVITLRDQMHEYMFRGEELDQMSLFTFILDTYDGKATQTNNLPDNDMEDVVDRTSC